MKRIFSSRSTNYSMSLSWSRALKGGARQLPTPWPSRRRKATTRERREMTLWRKRGLSLGSLGAPLSKVWRRMCLFKKSRKIWRSITQSNWSSRMASLRGIRQVSCRRKLKKLLSSMESCKGPTDLQTSLMSRKRTNSNLPRKIWGVWMEMSPPAKSSPPKRLVIPWAIRWLLPVLALRKCMWTCNG